jgi:hypothetical protein
VELSDAVHTLYFDAAHGPVSLRQRGPRKGKMENPSATLWTQGLVQNPTGFFHPAVRKNWMLSSSYAPASRSPPPVSAG